MKLSLATVNTLAEMICGSSGGFGGYSWDNFPYRSSSRLTQFFRRCNLNYAHDGSTRQTWVYSVLEDMNVKNSQNPNLPFEGMVNVIRELANPVDYEREGLSYKSALEQLNKVLSYDGLQVKIVNSQAIVENLNTRTASHSQISGRILNKEEQIRYDAFLEFLTNASEDAFTEKLLQPLFQQLGFERVTVSGHRDKQMEFGKDIWMRYRLPTMHQLYIGVQVKIGRVHAAGNEVTTNISGILAQLLMLMTYPVFDPETNSKHLPDHVILVTSGDISKQARTLLSEFLDNAMRRNVLFIDKNDILDLCIKHSLPVPEFNVDDIPF